jgi:hypothetical protein
MLKNRRNDNKSNVAMRICEKKDEFSRAISEKKDKIMNNRA